jgi:hypothetical protein
MNGLFHSYFRNKLYLLISITRAISPPHRGLHHGNPKDTKLLIMTPVITV